MADGGDMTDVTDGRFEALDAVLSRPEVRALPAATPAGIISLHDDLVAEMREELGRAAAEADPSADIAVTLPLVMIERLVATLLTAARDAARGAIPVEIAVEVEGGLVQSVVRDAGDPRPIRVYVHDNDTEGRGEDEDDNVALLEYNNRPGETFESFLTVHEGEPVPADTRYWETLRAEGARLETTT